jgi:hypothetical protein
VSRDRAHGAKHRRTAEACQCRPRRVELHAFFSRRVAVPAKSGTHCFRMIHESCRLHDPPSPLVSCRQPATELELFYGITYCKHIDSSSRHPNNSLQSGPCAQRVCWPPGTSAAAARYPKRSVPKYRGVPAWTSAEMSPPHPIQLIDSRGLRSRLVTRKARWIWSCNVQGAAGFGNRVCPLNRGWPTSYSPAPCWGGGRARMPSLVAHIDQQPSATQYPHRIISPPRAGTFCLFSEMAEVGPPETDARWVYQ